MSKARRGKGIRNPKEYSCRGRGVCPACNRGGVKLLYEQTAGEKKVKVCKICKAAIKHGKKSLV